MKKAPGKFFWWNSELDVKFAAWNSKIVVILLHSWLSASFFKERMYLEVSDFLQQRPWMELNTKAIHTVHSHTPHDQKETLFLALFIYLVALNASLFLQKPLRLSQEPISTFSKYRVCYFIFGFWEGFEAVFLCLLYNNPSLLYKI